MFKKLTKYKNKFNINTVVSVAFLLFILLLFMLFDQSGMVKRLENMMYDLKVYGVISTDKNLKPDKDIVIITANDITFKRLAKQELGFNRWPWPRYVLAEALECLYEANPKAVMLYLNYDISQGPEKDNRVLTVMEKYKYLYSSTNLYGFKDVYIAKNNKRVTNEQLNQFNEAPLLEKINIIINRLTSQQLIIHKSNAEAYDYYVHKHYTKSEIPDNLTLKVDDNDASKDSELMEAITFCNVSNIPESFAKVFRLISTSFIHFDEDAIVRAYRPLYRYAVDGRYVASCGFVSFVDITGKRNITLKPDHIKTAGKKIPIDKDGKTKINFRYNFSTYKHFDLLNIIIANRIIKGTMTPEQTDSPEFFASDLKKYLKNFENKYIILGVERERTDEKLAVPMSHPLSRFNITANTLDNYINCGPGQYERFIRPMPLPLTIIITLLFAVIVCKLLLHYERILIKLTFVFAGALLYLLLCFTVFFMPWLRLDMPAVYPLFIIIFSSVSAFMWQYNTVYRKRQEIDSLFGKFISPQIKQRLVDDPSLINFEGEKKELTVLFCDLRGFTSISEAHPSSQVFSQLNHYLSEMVNIIINEYNGTLDKFMGDAIMAFWGDPIPQENHQELAIRTAIRMKERLSELNAQWVQKGWPKLKLGIGINTGEMHVGHLGGGILLDYTVIGDNVNIASRLESMNKEYSTQILISESTYLPCKNIVNAVFVAQRTLKGKTSAVNFYEIIGLKE